MKLTLRHALPLLLTLGFSGLGAAHAEEISPEAFSFAPLKLVQLPPDEEVLVSAFSLMGTPYRSGGDSPQAGGFDCSGFVRFVYQQAGLELPARSSRDLFGALWSRVSRDGLHPGDLVFFGGRRGVSHVGIYVGNDRFIHAPARGGAVRVDSLSEPYWQRTYTGARRVLAG